MTFREDDLGLADERRALLTPSRLLIGSMLRIIHEYRGSGVIPVVWLGVLG